jgi:glycosyltransferase involved in cell wall biosynthesis
MQSTPVITIITPVYNGAAFLDDLIISVRDQDYPLVEHIVIDDGSNDDGATVAILKKYPHLRWWSHENRGQYPTMNEGLEAASGDIICFISADDVMTAGAISTAVTVLTKNQKNDGVYGHFTYIDNYGALYWYQPLIKYAPIICYRYIPYIAHCSLYLRKKCLIEHKLTFNPSLLYTGDYDWVIRMIVAGLKIGYVDSTLSQIRWHNQRASYTKTARIRAEQIRVWNMYGVNPFFFKALNVSIDYLLIKRRLISAFFKHDRVAEISSIRSWVASRKVK